MPGSDSPAPTRAAPVTISIRDEYGWRSFRSGGVELWVKGYGRVRDGTALVRQLGRLGPQLSLADAASVVDSLDGHFALVARGQGWTIAAVDRVGSVPVAYGKGATGWVIDDQAERLRRHLGLGQEDVDPDAALALAMSGYTVDVATLYKGVYQLGPGELALLRDGAMPQRHRYYTYRPWRADKPAYNPNRARKVLADTLLAIIDTMMSSLDGRMLVVPLSAGRDSRLIVSAARHLGYENVKTFAYGRKGNHESRTSRFIAEKLGYEWKFVPTGISMMRRHYQSEVWSAYCAYADTLRSTPFVQDLPQISSLIDDGYIPGDAVFANGNSGDYISGAHVLPDVRENGADASAESRLARIVEALSRKHFSLWMSLRTLENCRRIEQLLGASIERAGAIPGAPENDFGIYEYAEFQDRQCKYVISGQRIYEFLGHDWRLPLWDNALLDFFEKVPLEAKVGQKLYSETLERENWGGVWQGVPVNRRTIKPDWIRPLRFMAKVLHAPAGRTAWHGFEKRYFGYWMELGAQSAIRPYGAVAGDRRGARHGVAWLTEDYLARHGLNYGGQVHAHDA